MSSKTTWLADGTSKTTLRGLGWLLYVAAAIQAASALLDVATGLLGTWSWEFIHPAMQAGGFALFASVHHALAEERARRWRA